VEFVFGKLAEVERHALDAPAHHARRRLQVRHLLLLSGSSLGSPPRSVLRSVHLSNLRWWAVLPRRLLSHRPEGASRTAADPAGAQYGLLRRPAVRPRSQQLCRRPGPVRLRSPRQSPPPRASPGTVILAAARSSTRRRTERACSACDGRHP